MKVQTLDNVCNGGHLWELSNATKEELAKHLFSMGKVIVVVGNAPEINEDCDCDDCRNPEDPQKSMRQLLDTIVATGNEGMHITWQRERAVFNDTTLKTEKKKMEEKITLYAKRVGAWSNSGTLYFIKTQPIE